MKIIVTGLPRNRTSLIVNNVADIFSLKKPENLWGETHKFGENINHWLVEPNAIYKLWSIHSDTFIETLENFDGGIIVSYTEDFPLFVAKLLRAHVTSEWGISLRDKQKISFREHLSDLQSLESKIVNFRQGLVSMLSSQKIVLKSAFVNKDQVSVHIQSSFNPKVAALLRTIAKDYKPESIKDYIEEQPEDFNEYIRTTFGSGI